MNQQLDNRRLQSRQASKAQRGDNSSLAPAPRPSTSQPNQLIKSSYETDRVSSEQLARLESQPEADVQPTSLGAPKSKLSSWLERGSVGGNKSASFRPSSSAVISSTSLSSRNRDRQTNLSSAPLVTDIRRNSNWQDDREDSSIEGLLSANSLQEMSKQKLISLILEKLEPKLRHLQQESSKSSLNEVERLKNELQKERFHLEVFQLRHDEQLKLEEQKRLQQINQLEERVKFSEDELSKSFQIHRDHLKKLDEQYRENLTKLSENFDQKLLRERAHYEDQLSRREHLFKLELESKLKVDSNLEHLETFQDNWQLMLKETIGQLKEHLKSVQALLEVQTSQVNGTNKELAEKTTLLNENYAKFDACNQKISHLADEMGSTIPSIKSAQLATQELVDKSVGLLSELSSHLKEVEQRKQELDKRKADIDTENARQARERMELELRMGKLEMKEERVNELLEINKGSELRWQQKLNDQQEQEQQLHVRRSNLEAKTVELREQNLELHLMRKQLTGQREELMRSRLEFEQERKLNKGKILELKEETKRLATIRDQVEREMSQLRRVQKSLVCSLCLNRLFTTTTQDELQEAFDEVHISTKLLDDKPEDTMTTKVAHISMDSLARAFEKTSRSQTRDLDLTARNYGFSRHQEKQLGAEDKFVEMLSTNK